MASEKLSPPMKRLIDALAERMVSDHLAGRVDENYPCNSRVTVPEKAGKTRKRAVKTAGSKTKK